MKSLVTWTVVWKSIQCTSSVLSGAASSTHGCSARTTSRAFVQAAPNAEANETDTLRLDVPQLESRIAVITGAGRGIGRALALGFGAAHYCVAAADIDEPAANDTASLLRATGASALGVRVDMAEPESITRMIETVVAEWGGLDVLVNNAGVFPRALVVDYAASKAGVVAFSRNLALELAPHRITVNVLAPGLVNTAQPRQDNITEEQLAARGATIPFGRMAEPDEMVPTVLFLCSAGAAYITGQTLHVNGGSWMA
jgi:NAD(P)-dependent dehydrogenase (short-subunit alcohol dehydrogenase family)